MLPCILHQNHRRVQLQSVVLHKIQIVHSAVSSIGEHELHNTKINQLPVVNWGRGSYIHQSHPLQRVVTYELFTVCHYPSLSPSGRVANPAATQQMLIIAPI